MNLDYTYMLESLPEIMSYIPVTLRLTAMTFVIAIPFAIVFTYILVKKIPVVSQIIKVYISLIRGTPILLQIYVIFTITPTLLQHYFDSIGKNVDIYAIDNSWYAYLALSLSTVVFLTEAFRSALGTVDRGQVEAAYMVGMTGIEAYKRIVFPQALGVALPIITNIVVDTIKATSLAFTMVVTEVMGEAKILGGMSSRYFEMYLDAFLVYILIICVVEFLLKHLEKYCLRYKTHEF